jgi:NAD(P)-dependent dehydrogenase (short-subunit alcohol dehydrogenase family)
VNKYLSLKNKIVLITGSSRGIGKEIAKKFLENGAIVIGISKDKDIKSIIKTKKYEHFFCDLNNKEDIQKTLNKITKKFKQVNILINNAGITLESSKSEIKNINNFNRTIKINLTAPYIFSSSIVKKMAMKKQGGTIINISSIGGELGFPNNPAYLSSKSALIGLTRSFARDFGKYNINCNAVLPGYFKTDMNKKSLNNRSKRIKRANLTMLGRWGELHELVGVILFLSTKEAKYITGQKIIVDGGIVSKGL